MLDLSIFQGYKILRSYFYQAYFEIVCVFHYKKLGEFFDLSRYHRRCDNEIMRYLPSPND